MRDYLQENWRPEESWVGLVFAVSAKMRASAVHALQRVGLDHLSMSRIGILNLLSQKAKTQAELCLALGYKAPTMMDFLKRMRKRGLVQVEPHPEDKRKKYWSLTPQGRSELSQARAALRRRGAKIDRFFTAQKIQDEELRRFKGILKSFLKITL